MKPVGLDLRYRRQLQRLAVTVSLAHLCAFAGWQQVFSQGSGPGAASVTRPVSFLLAKAPETSARSKRPSPPESATQSPLAPVATATTFTTVATASSQQPRAMPAPIAKASGLPARVRGGGQSAAKASPTASVVNTLVPSIAPAPTAMELTQPAASALAHPEPDHAAPAHALGPVQVPDARRLGYDVQGEAKHFPYSAHAELLWQPQAQGNYTARLEIAALLFAARVQTSSGRITAEGLAPTRFSDKLKTEVAAHFEREKGLITFSANTPDVALQRGAQDRLSVLVQLAALFAGDPQRYPLGSVIKLQTVGPRDADDWHFTVQESETLALPIGAQVTRKLVREPRREFDVRVEVWLGQTLSYLPVQLRMTQANGDFVQLQLKNVDFL